MLLQKCRVVKYLHDTTFVIKHQVPSQIISRSKFQPSSFLQLSRRQSSFHPIRRYNSIIVQAWMVRHREYIRNELGKGNITGPRDLMWTTLQQSQSPVFCGAVDHRHNSHSKVYGFFSVRSREQSRSKFDELVCKVCS